MVKFDDDVGKKLDAPSKRKIYGMLVAKARPALLKAKDVCLLGLCNWRYGEWLRDEFPNIRKVTVIESKQLRFMYRDLESLEAYNIVYVEDNRYVEVLEGLMKFDCIIQNPPYQRNLHLKILAEAIKHLKDDGVCVNLSPVRWLQDPLAKYKKTSDLKRFKESVAKHIESLDIIDKTSALQMFDAGFTMNLGVYKCNSKKTSYDYLSVSANSIVAKVMSKMQASFADKIENNKLDGWRVRVNEIQPLEACDKRDPSTQAWRHYIINPNTPTYVYKDGYTKDGVFWADLVQKGKYTKSNGDPLVWSIPFSTEQEAYNFEAFCKTTFMNALKNIMQQDIHVPLFAFPWLGDAVNPRTKLKGYTGEWTNDDLYKFFNITPAEQKVIEDTMEKYKQ